jgi:dTDP-4-amino-4,6-dideoxygalactose transaminase
LAARRAFFRAAAIRVNGLTHGIMTIEQTSDPRATPRGFMRSVTTFERPGQKEIGRLIPRPRIPIQPVLSREFFGVREHEDIASVLSGGEALYVTAGRVAIAHALVLGGLKPGGKVLIPAYHCIAMVEPIVQLGGVPVFYRIREDLSVDLEDVAEKLDERTGIFLAVNYFGFPQDLFALREFCDRHSLVFIEDCAHSFFGAHQGRALGSFGDYAIASLPKFFAVREGGCLIVNRRDGPSAIGTRSQGLAANLAAILDSVEDAVEFGRLRALKPLVGAAALAKRAVHAVAPSLRRERIVNPAEQRSGQTGSFDLAWMQISATAMSRLVAQHSSRRRIAERRRRHYQSLVQAFAASSRARPVMPRLPEAVVPYMFPLWIDRLSDIFATLEDHAVPMQRFGQFLWPAAPEEFCPVSRQMSQKVLLLPCHQELTDAELAALVDKVRGLVA